MVKKIERICKNCKLYDPREGHCTVVILHEGQKFNIPVDPGDPCFFEQEYFDPVTKTLEDFNEIKEIRMWVEDEKGQKTTQGIVKVQYPDDLKVQYPDDLEMKTNRPRP